MNFPSPYRQLACLLLVAGVATTLISLPALGQVRRPAPTPMRDAQKSDSKEPEAPQLPNDERLLKLHLEFVKGAERLAAEYEKASDLDKAKAAYREILKLVPQYAPARTKLDAILAREATARKHTFDVAADQGWQDTGIRCLPGKPIAMRAAGTWTFTLSVKIGPQGIEIPKELREYNIGCLIGVIDAGNPDEFQPFVIGAEKQIVPDKAGRLMVRMWDIDPSDNQGKMAMEFVGTFDVAKGK